MAPFSSTRLLSIFSIPLSVAVLVVSAFAGSSAEVIYRFQGGTDGYYPAGTLLEDGAGNLYGTTSEGGTPGQCGGVGCGTVFKLSPPSKAGDPWVETVLYRFQGGSDGSAPGSGLVADQRGNLYSSTAAGGGLRIGDDL